MNWSKSAESPLHPTTSMSMHAHASARCNSRKIRDTLNNLILKSPQNWQTNVCHLPRARLRPTDAGTGLTSVPLSLERWPYLFSIWRALQSNGTRSGLMFV